MYLYHLNVFAMNMLLKMFPFVLLIFLIVRPVENANILFVTSFPAVSHQSAFQPIWKELSLRGHKVTVIASHPLKDKSLTNLTEIDTSEVQKIAMKSMPKDLVKYLFQKPTFLMTFIKDAIVTSLFSESHKRILKYEKVQQLIKGNQQFDIVIAEWLFPTMAAFSVRFNCPLVGITSLGAPIVALDTVGNPSHPILSPDHNLPIGRELSFRDRMLSTLYSIYVRVYYRYVVLPREDRTIKEVFGEHMPYIGDIERNVSAILLNRNTVFHKIMPVLPNVVELGRVRKVKMGKPLDAVSKWKLVE